MFLGLGFAWRVLSKFTIFVPEAEVLEYSLQQKDAWLRLLEAVRDE
jgi:hypothetical protein